MSIYAIADLHLSFQSNKPMDIFGAKWERHAEKIKDNWLNTVKDEDTVLICGDLSWALKLDEAKEDFDFIGKLPGNKIIIKGNHDLWWESISKMERALPPSIKILQNNFYLVEDLAICGTRGWVTPLDDSFTEHDYKIYNRELLRLENSLQRAVKDGCQNIFVMLHYPPFNNRKEKTAFVDLLKKYEVKKCVYGHLHGDAHYVSINGVRDGIEYNLVAADYLNFLPLLIKK